ncbi:class I SAM-dependent methyltransferase [Rhizobium jaguaris]|uniref:Methyltransferase domain-containing protein n=1 Tax=Rhizobium jaguaris TaxID=1312183 RepID=A0A387FVJ6_9HYPH|nr:methyltransferase domain-containing protein [Rhizobium jaguaris]AYG62423.1 methyltransferase domain-containing protein [Rhizobium jaguaris]
MVHLPYTKIIDIADFSNPLLLPHLEDIARGEMLRFGLDKPEIVPDSKQWECAMMLRTLSDHGVLRPGAVLAGVGAGTEETTFAIAAKGCVVFPTDRYLETTPWSDVAPAGMMVRPNQFSQFDCPRGSIIPVHSDARVLSLPSNFFDGVYSAGSIEHFGSIEAVAAAAEEIGRILKPGGIAVLSTEFRLDGPVDKQWFSDDCILFTPALLQEHIIESSGLEVIGTPVYTTSQDTYDSRVVLIEFLQKAKSMTSLSDKKNAYPNLVLYHDGYLFCSVHLALRKPISAVSRQNTRSVVFENLVNEEAARAGAILTRQISEWTQAYSKRDSSSSSLAINEHSAHAALAEHANRYKIELAAQANRYEIELAAIRGSRSFRFTKPLRYATTIARRVPIVVATARLGLRGYRAIRGLVSGDKYRSGGTS